MQSDIQLLTDMTPDDMITVHSYNIFHIGAILIIVVYERVVIFV